MCFVDAGLSQHNHISFDHIQTQHDEVDTMTNLIGFCVCVMENINNFKKNYADYVVAGRCKVLYL